MLNIISNLYTYHLPTNAIRNRHKIRNSIRICQFLTSPLSAQSLSELNTVYTNRSIRHETRE